AEFRSGANSLSEGCLVAGRVVQHLDHFQVLAVLEREDDIACSESWMHATLDELQAERLGDSLRGWHQPIRAACITYVIQPHHVPIMATCDGSLYLGNPKRGECYRIVCGKVLKNTEYDRLSPRPSACIANIFGSRANWMQVMSPSNKPRLTGRQPSTAVGCPG